MTCNPSALLACRYGRTGNHLRQGGLLDTNGRSIKLAVPQPDHFFVQHMHALQEKHEAERAAIDTVRNSPRRVFSSEGPQGLRQLRERNLLASQVRAQDLTRLAVPI